MRLINTRSLELTEFHGAVVPPYAILSHMWVEGEEVSFQEFTARRNPPTTTTAAAAATKSGYRKIQRACEIALGDGLDWIWIDTNCIDKSSSAELTEAINSMYNWYRDAEVCYAYLCDVPDLDEGGGHEEDPLYLFRRSRYFYRGWTLQELIGPPRLVFYSQNWSEIGERSQSLAAVISSVTNIEEALLRGLTDLRQVSIAKKMSWAATRQTTRVEDIAYCLLGLFDVNMPLLYGEGTKAFIRLQEEIIRTTNDHTIFCWARNSSVAPGWTSTLAPSPAAFRDSSDYIPMGSWEAPMPYTMTNLGLSIHLPVVYSLTQMFVVLNAGLSRHDPNMRASIAMQRTNPRRSGSNILDRNRLLESPVMLSKEATDVRERYNLFIRSRYIPPPRSQYVTPSPMFKHAVLLFVDPTATKLLSTSKRGMPLGAVGFDIETHPPGIFDANTSLLKLPAFDGGSAFFTSGLVRIHFKSPQEADVYLFFAVILTLGGKEAWHCGVHCAEDFTCIKLALEEEGEDGHLLDEGELPSEIVVTHQYLCSEAWESGRQRLEARSSDDALFVSMGGALPGHGSGGRDIRTAVISGKSDPPHPVPAPESRSNGASQAHPAYVESSEGSVDDDESEADEMRLSHHRDF